MKVKKATRLYAHLRKEVVVRTMTYASASLPVNARVVRWLKDPRLSLERCEAT
jgi:hypothetical protein